MRSKVRMSAAALLGSVMIVSMAPVGVMAGGGKMLQQCLAARTNEPDQQQVRSECMWKHHEYMASYGR